MKTAVQIVGWHPRWEKIASIKAICISSDCGLADAKRVVDRALTEEFAEFHVEGLEEAKCVSQELADLGAVVSCADVTYDSFEGDDRGIPYRKEAVGTIIAVGTDLDDVFAGRLIHGSALERFDLSIPMNGSLDFRVAATLVEQSDAQITFTIDCEDVEEREFWREMLVDTETEADIHEPG